MALCTLFIFKFILRGNKKKREEIYIYISKKKLVCI